MSTSGLLHHADYDRLPDSGGESVLADLNNQFVFGGITVLCGLAMFAQPVAGMFTITAVLIAYFLVDGVFVIFAGLRGKPAPGWGWMTVSGIASVVLAILLWRQWPASGAVALGLLMGIRLIFTGWSIAMLGMAGDAAIDAVQKADQ